MHQVGFGRKRGVFSMNEIHAEPPFLCDFLGNGYCKRVITLTAESKHVLFNHKLHTKKWRLTFNVVSALNWSGVHTYIYIYIYIYIYNSLNTLSGSKSCLVTPEVAVPPGTSETVLSHLVGRWWGQGIACAFTRCMMKKCIIIIWSWIHIHCQMTVYWPNGKVILGYWS